MALPRKTKAALRRIPSMDRLLSRPEVADLCARHGRDIVKTYLREELAVLRRTGAADVSGWEARLPAALAGHAADLSRPRLRRVINATGVIIHTNLGRAPLAAAALEAVAQVSRGYSNLEYDLTEGRRGKRGSALEPLVCRLTGAEAAHVVNNNAAAVFLALATLSHGKETVLSRGEMVEIGASFRIPDICAASGALLREVGTTNKTRLSDYERAVSRRTGCLLKAHPSNYRIRGFTQSVPIKALAALARRKRLPLIYDLGSGHLSPLAEIREPLVRNTLREGADVVAFSGDKLLGGPQAGILAGRRKYIETMKRHPLSRALRVDKMTAAALEATLRLHLLGKIDEIPVLRMIRTPLEELHRRARAMAETLHSKHPGWNVDVTPAKARIGGGSTPETFLPSTVLAIQIPGRSPNNIARALRGASPPVVGRISEERLLLDLRSVTPEEDAALAEALLALP